MVGHERRQERLERRLLQQIRRQAIAPNLRRLVGWLAEVVDGHVMLTNSDGFPLAASSKAAHEVLAPAADEISRVAAGELKSAVLDERALKARLFAIGPEAPHAVLAAARTKPYPPEAAEAVSRVADVLALLLPALSLEHAWHQVHEAAAEVHVAILQLLMSGQATFARRAAASLASGALADTVRVYIVDCSTGDRHYTAEIIQQEIRNPSPPGVTMPTPEPALIDGALLVPCPAYDNHLIVVAPADNEPPSAQGSESVDATLRRVTAALYGHYLGISEAAALAHTADAYRDAARALSVAQHLPERAWQYNSHAQLTAVIDQEEAYHWAEAFLQPLINASRAERDDLFTTVRLALAFPTTKVAKVLDVHRNTVASRFKKAAELLQLDLSDVQACAVLDLALQIDAAAPVGRRKNSDQAEAGLQELLSTPSTKAWAEMTLAPLNQDDRNLRRTLRVWFAHNASADCAATELGIHPQTVRGHLRSAERLLQRTLLAGASGGHDLVIALFIAGDIPTPPRACGISHQGFFDRFLDPSAETHLPPAG
ncbi:helix-turn-helix domain-containing protein [Streptomyces sp. ISL-1]|uniref:helix-turn-helix domain-containing protein n=1 Tax=Streptomyces sp. ISL-1 TaxID=2817657 RepID=UPI001BE9B831|nr:helix-turn-helix domain-containing protein [Streptomyces sp. ISL-1]MBT2391811.1 helix-turn-helix domain-containing protein [Streptomyces sp. ISL-1]